MSGQHGEKNFREKYFEDASNQEFLLATQDKNIVKRKHALEIASFEWRSSDQALAKVHGTLFRGLL